MRSLLLLLLVTTSSWAGLTVSGTLTHGNEKGTLKQFFQDQNVRLDFQMGPKNGAFIYQTRSGVILWIDHAKKSFIEMNKADLDRLLVVFSSFAKNQPAPPAEVKLTKEADGVKVGVWRCARYGLTIRGAKAGRCCVLPMESVGASRADYRPLETLMDTVLKIGAIPADSKAIVESLSQALNHGFIMQSEQTDPSGNPQGGYVTTAIDRKVLAANTFKGPAGYQRQDIMALLQKQVSGK